MNTVKNIVLQLDNMINITTMMMELQYISVSKQQIVYLKFTMFTSNIFN